MLVSQADLASIDEATLSKRPPTSHLRRAGLDLLGLPRRLTCLELQELRVPADTQDGRHLLRHQEGRMYLPRKMPRKGRRTCLARGNSSTNHKSHSRSHHLNLDLNSPEDTLFHRHTRANRDPSQYHPELLPHVPIQLAPEPQATRLRLRLPVQRMRKLQLQASIAQPAAASLERPALTPIPLQLALTKNQ